MTEAATHDFWLSSGHHLLDHDADGHLVLTDEFLRVYLARPEVIPPDDACDAERALYIKLAGEPRLAVTAGEISAIRDRDARENWRLLVSFRDALLAAPTLEAAYLSLVRARTVTTPPRTRLIRTLPSPLTIASYLSGELVDGEREKTPVSGTPKPITDAETVQSRHAALSAVA